MGNHNGVHLSHINASAAFDKLNRCLQDVKEWMSASKLTLNPDETEFKVFGSKKQRERLNACFPINILGNPLQPSEFTDSLVTCMIDYVIYMSYRVKYLSY